MCACQQCLSLLVKYYETYLVVLVKDICYIVNWIHYKMIWWSVKWCILLNRSLHEYKVKESKNNIHEQLNMTIYICEMEVPFPDFYLI